MDPGNWATDLAGGAKYGYTLLSVIMISNLMAILLQALSARLGIASGRDLAQACRDSYSRPVTIVLWLLCEVAIAACDLAEVIGAAIALNLLFGLPLIWGVCLTALDVLIVLFLQHRGFRYVEALVIALIALIAGSFAVELWLAGPTLGGVASGFIPRTVILSDPNMLYIAIGILGATVMPHNLYLHSSIVQTRKYGDLAEVIGAAIALNLLFGLPLIWGVCLTALDVLVVLFLQHRGFRYVEALVIALIALIAGSFAVELWLAGPTLGGVALGFIPRTEILRNPDMLYIAIGILGATVMPHNLYLHSSIVQTRKYGDLAENKREAIRFASIDSAVALMFALFINAAILVMSAAAFHGSGHEAVADINDAYLLLSPLMGTKMASILFAVALLASGQSSTITGTLAGQIVMEGFINLRLRPWLRRLITRLIAIIPAIIVIALYGDRGTGPLIILSQVVLSLQLPFAVFPLVMFTSDPHKMGEFANALWVKLLAYTVAVIIAALNIYMLYQIFTGL